MRKTLRRIRPTYFSCGAAITSALPIQSVVQRGSLISFAHRAGLEHELRKLPADTCIMPSIVVHSGYECTIDGRQVLRVLPYPEHYPVISRIFLLSS